MRPAVGNTGGTWFQRLPARVPGAAALLVVALILAACSTSPAKTGNGSPTTSPPGPSPSPFPLQSVDWATVALGLLNCGEPGPSTPPAANVGQVSYVTPDSAHQLAVVLASCAAGAGSPPAGLYAFDRATSTTDAHLLQTLLPSTLDRLAQAFAVTPTASAEDPSALSGQSVTMQESAYSSASVADCCPDFKYPVTWSWTGAGYSGSPADRAAGYPITATVSPASVTVADGDTVSFTVTVANVGSQQVRSASLFVGTSGLTNQGLGWVSGSPSCRFSSAVGEATCTIGSLPPGASVSVGVKVKVSTSTGPLSFAPGIEGQLAAGRFLPFLPTATVTVTG